MPTKFPPNLLFEANRLIADELNEWAECTHAPCRAAQYCLGGPRGTCARTGGFTLCSQEGRARIAAGDTIWSGTELSEPPSARRRRRFEAEMLKLKTSAIIKNLPG